MTIDDPAIAEWMDGNVGLAHAYSGTCAIDVDDLAKATTWLHERGVNLHALLTAPDCVRIESRQGRAKLLYRIDKPLPSYNLGPIEFRCASKEGKTVQDVLPPSIHPDTRLPYTWKYGSKDGHWSKLPPLPPALAVLWTALGAGDIRDGSPRQEVQKPKGKQKLAEIVPRLRESLKAWPADSIYDDWIKVGMAIHYETGGADDGLALWNEWSAKGQKYKGMGDLDVHWRSFRADAQNPITLASLRRESAATPDEFPDIIAGTPAVVPPPSVSRELALQGIRGLSRNKQSQIEARISNISTVLALPEISGQHLALDEFLDIIVIAPSGTQDWRPLKDTDYTAMRGWLETGGNCEPISHEMMRQAAHLVAEQFRTDSAKNWLGTLQWDGTERVKHFAPLYFGTEDTSYTRAVGMYLWTALAGRVLSPGCQADMVPVLVGPQGVGKTRGVEAIAPHPDQFGELRIDEPDDAIARKLRGRLIVEMAEMRGVRTAEIERLKAFITRTHERWIPKYMEFATNYPRRAIIVGTTNDEDFLPLDTEHRRWLPLSVSRVDVERIKQDRDQLWAEAAILFTIDGIAWRGMDTLAAPARQEAQGHDIWEDDLQRWLLDNGAARHRTHTLLTAALGFDPRHVTRVHELRLAKVMRKMGWEKKAVREGDQVFKAWVIDPLM